MIKFLSRFTLKLNFLQEDVQSEIKKMYRSNRKPAVNLLLRWKQLQNLQTFTENAFYTFQLHYEALQIEDALKRVFETRNLQKVHKSLEESIALSREASGSFIRIQDVLFHQGIRLQKSLQQQEASLSGIITPDETEQTLLQEIHDMTHVQQILTTDPEFLSTIPENMKQQIEDQLKQRTQGGTHALI